MTEFEDLRAEIQGRLSERAGRGVSFRMRDDADVEIMSIYGHKATTLACARTGLEDVEELASVAVEHHPYWNLLYQCLQIARMALDRWEETVTDEDIAQMRWSAAELESAIRRLSE